MEIEAELESMENQKEQLDQQEDIDPAHFLIEEFESMNKLEETSKQM